MLVKPSITELLRIVDNRFELVIATAKRARQISYGATILTDEKNETPVTIAATEIAEGRVKIVC